MQKIKFYPIALACFVMMWFYVPIRTAMVTFSCLLTGRGNLGYELLAVFGAQAVLALLTMLPVVGVLLLKKKDIYLMLAMVLCAVFYVSEFVIGMVTNFSVLYLGEMAFLTLVGDIAYMFLAVIGVLLIAVLVFLLQDEKWANKGFMKFAWFIPAAVFALGFIAARLFDFIVMIVGLVECGPTNWFAEYFTFLTKFAVVSVFDIVMIAGLLALGCWLADPFKKQPVVEEA